MRNLLYVVCAVLFGILLTSCLDDDSLEHSDTLRGNFEACWQTIDQHYCYFDEKKVNWDAVYHHYAPLFDDSVKTQLQLFNVLDDMLDLLQDGHVNIYAPFNTARNWHWHEDYPDNFDDNLIEHYYLGTECWIASGVRYTMLLEDSVAYIRYSSFEYTLGQTNLDYILSALRKANGLIIDIRDNGGGSLVNATTLAERFCTQRTLYAYMSHKTGSGHQDFSEPEPLYLERPDETRWVWDASVQPVVVLTNRSTYSAANNFAQAMRALDGTLTTDSVGQQHPKMIKLCGDRTGGGSGMPFESVLPNGWVMRFSACPMYDEHRASTESGIDPSPGLRIDLDSVSMYQLHRDDIIEAARTYILNTTRMERKSDEKEEKAG